jgi:hypothetical protein
MAGWSERIVTSSSYGHPTGDLPLFTSGSRMTNQIISIAVIAYVAQAAIGFSVGLVLPWLHYFGFL